MNLKRWFGILVACLVIESSWSRADDVFRAGVASVDISPTRFPVIIAGGFLEGRGDRNQDALYVRAFVFDDGKMQIAIAVVDTCMMEQSLIDQAKEIASSQCGIPINRMLVSATHSHSAPAAMGCLGTRQDKQYADELPGKIAAAIVKAHTRLQPAKIGYAAIDDWRHTHNRRWIRKPENKVVDPFGQATGLAHMHPGYLSPDVVGPSGPVDPKLTMISLQTADGKPLGILANYSQHYFGSPAVSSDYFGLFCKRIAKLVGQSEGESFIAALSQGTSGDLMWMDYGSANRSVALSDYANEVADVAHQALRSIQHHPSANLGFVEKTLTLNYRVPDIQRLEWARPIAAQIVDDLPKNIPQVYAREALILHQRQKTSIKLQAIRIGDLTIAAIPNEVYAITGLKLRQRTPARFHFNVELANGAEGYIPPPEQHTLGGYTTWPARTAGLEVQAEPTIVETLASALEEVTGKPQRTIAPTGGPYVDSILASRPVGFWRLDDIDGQLATNSIVGGQPAHLNGGFAFYLPGVGSGTGIGHNEALTPSAFSVAPGINRSIHFAGGKVVTQVNSNLQDFTAVGWVWLGERSGASQRNGSVMEAPNGVKLMARQYQNHKVRFELGTTAANILSENDWHADHWSMLTFTCNSGQCDLYVNGSKQITLKHLNSPKTQSSIAPNQIVWANGLQGKLDELAIFDRVLTAEEIQELWRISEMGERQASELARLEKEESERKQKIAPPVFPPTYHQALAATSPTQLMPLQFAPDNVAKEGAINFDASTFASLKGGRLSVQSAITASQFSVGIWFRNETPNNSRPVTAYLASRGAQGDPQAPGDHLGIGGNFRSDMTGKLFVFNGNARDQVVVGKTTIAPESWHYVVFVRDGDRVRVFLDGRTEPEIDASLENTDLITRHLFLGARSDFFAPLQGNLAYAVLYDRSLDGAQATRLYTESGRVALPNPSNTGGLPKPASDPIAARESLSKIHVPQGYSVSLVAHEPQTIDPVAFDWDHSGRLWVCEMADYPLGMDGKGQPGGRIRVLDDLDRDGVYESSRLFADGLNFPNGVMVWRDGVLVTAAPQLLYLRDVNGDGVADHREVLFEGFNEGNQQLRMNHLRWGLDGWVYCANGGHHANHGLGTKVVSIKTGKTYEIGSRDFRIRPDTGELELESGPSQYGRNRDAFGRWFGTQNANPLWHYVLPDRYLSRNPYVATPTAIQHVVGPNSPKVYPASQPEKRFHSFEQSGRFTSACSGMIFGDTRLFGEASQATHAFTCEPFHNLIQHNLLYDSGTSFTSKHPEDEGEFDFFASEDRWCRPVMARTGPDGALWVADMYRYMIEHPDWLPAEGKAELLPHYRLGDDSGRIYKVWRNGDHATHNSETCWINPKDIDRILMALQSANDWQRDKAHQLLVWNDVRSATDALERLAIDGKLAATRVQALWILDVWEALNAQVLGRALQDPDPRVRENAVRLAERHNASEVHRSAIELSSDPDAKVCLQVALSLGQWREQGAAEALAKIAARFGEDPLMVAAVMSSAVPHINAMIDSFAGPDGEKMQGYREPLMRQVLAQSDTGSIERLLNILLAKQGDAKLEAVDDFLVILQSLDVSLDSLAERGKGTGLEANVQSILDMQQSAREIAGDTNQPESSRWLASRVLCRSARYQSEGVRYIAQWLNPQYSPDWQIKAVRSLGQTGHPDVPSILAAAWPELSPNLRTAALDAWLSRGEWTKDLVGRMERKELQSSSLSLQQRARLLKHPDRDLAQRSAPLLESQINTNRKQVVDRYLPALANGGDTERGKAVFMRACATCHKKGNDGNELGPNLATVANHSPEKLLTNILDPNADIQPGYQSYSCLLQTGEIVVGLLASETANGLTIKQANGMTRSVPRREIEQLLNSNVSFMPDGLESTISPQEMADLIEFLRR